MKNIFVVFVLVGLIFSCKKQDEKITTDSSANLRFSVDTLQFDTLLTTIGSISKKIKVYNDSKNAVIISKIMIENGQSSVYEVIINGKKTQSINNLQLLGKDSLLIIVQANLGENQQNSPYVIRDILTFETNNNVQKVYLEAWGRDAHFIKNGVLACDTKWINDKAYVISDSVIIPKNCTLTIEKGCHILFKYNAKMIVEGTLQVLGTKDSMVRFFNDNDLGIIKKEALGYWKGIIFTSNSTNNFVEYLHVENAFDGLSFEKMTIDSITDITLKNTQISNMLNTAILSKGNDIVANNSIFNNCATHLLSVQDGGNYHFTHCTFAHIGIGSKKEAIAVEGKGKITLINSIVWGGQKNEISLGEFQAYFFKNLLKTSQNLENNILNKNPLFIKIVEIDSLSPAMNQGTNTTILIDFKGNSRDNLPDMGAIEFQSKK